MKATMLKLDDEKMRAARKVLSDRYGPFRMDKLVHMAVLEIMATQAADEVNVLRAREVRREDDQG